MKLKKFSSLTSFPLLFGFQLVCTQLSNKTCETEACQKAARNIIKNMNLTSNPCENFYQFACGGFISHNNNSEGQDTVSVFTIAENQINEELQKIFSAKPVTQELDIFKSIKQFYDDCVSSEDGSSWFNAVMKKVKQIGGWPVISSKWNKKFSILDIMTKTWKMGFVNDFLWKIRVLPDRTNADKTILLISPPKKNCIFSSLGKTIHESYFVLMTLVAKKQSASNITSELNNLYDFERKLDKITCTDEKSSKQLKSRTKTFHTTVDEMQKNFSFTNWFELLSAQTALKKETIANSMNIVIETPKYFKRLNHLLKKTDNRTVINYIIWQTIYQSLQFDGYTRNVPRWKYCLDTMRQSWNLLFSAMYIRKYFDLKIKLIAENIIEAIKTETHNSIVNSTWFDAITKGKALRKINYMAINVGYPDIVLNDKKLIEYYKELHLVPGNYHASYMALERFNMKIRHGFIVTPDSRDLWLLGEVDPLEMNAIYIPLYNAVYIPAGFLMKTICNETRPAYLSFGSFGMGVGHEISHSFDIVGSQYDEIGNQMNWWSKHVKQKYTKRIQCFTNQYDKYELEDVGLKINGKRTVVENAADNNGLNNTYRAYKNWITQNGSEVALPGLNFTSAQMFWISAAQLWCSKDRSDFLMLQIKRDEHAPNEVRVLGAFSNQQDFAKDFNCPINSTMNPIEKCTL